jgi:FkbM family methyltransferase
VLLRYSLRHGQKPEARGGFPWLIDHISRSPAYSSYVAWAGVSSLVAFCTRCARGQRSALLGICEGLEPALRGIFSEYEAGFWAQVWLFDEYGVRNCRLVPGSLVIDIGANVGFFSWRVFACQPKATVVAFEPEKANLAKLSLVFSRLGIAGEVVAAACGSYDGPGQLYLRNPVTHSLVKEHHPELDEGRSAQVEVVRLDSWMAAHGLGAAPAELIKVDVEAAERDVLTGATRTLQRARHVVLEYHSSELGEACRRSLEELGFSTHSRSYWGRRDSGEGLLFAKRAFAKRAFAKRAG